MEQAEAIRLAEHLSACYFGEGIDGAAAELRRLHAINAELVEALEMANEITRTLEHVIEEVDQGGSYVLGSCYETSKRLTKAWWPVSGAALAKAKES